MHLLQIGPPRPLANHESLTDLQKRLQQYLDSFTEAPFTLQRLCELLVEPQKQYAHLHKVVLPDIIYIQHIPITDVLDVKFALRFMQHSLLIPMCSCISPRRESYVYRQTGYGNACACIQLVSGALSQLCCVLCCCCGKSIGQQTVLNLYT